jgi:hypothetical protein
VLYRKDLEPNETNIDRFAAEKKLPAHLKKYRRTPMTCQPEEVYWKIPISNENFTMYLHQNYIEIFQLKFSDQTFEKKFSALESICEAFMHADSLNKINFTDSSNSVNETKLKEIATIETMRSVLFNFSKEPLAQDATESKPKSMWMPLYKPFTHKITELRNKRIQQAEELLGKNQANSSTANSIYLNDINKEFFTTHLPYINLIGTKKPGYLKDIKINSGMILFSKYRPVNSKTSIETDQSSFKEDLSTQLNNFEIGNQTEESCQRRKASQITTKINDQLCVDDEMYENMEALSCIEEVVF